MVRQQLSMFGPIRLDRIGNAEDGEYSTPDRRYYVRLESSGRNHGAVTIEDRLGESLCDDFGPRSQVCRCGGLDGARTLIAAAQKEM